MNERFDWHRCLRCQYSWIGRREFKGDTGRPKRCARCRSRYWHTPRRKAQQITPAGRNTRLMRRLAAADLARQRKLEAMFPSVWRRLIARRHAAIRRQARERRQKHG